MAISVMGGNSLKVLPLQPIESPLLHDNFSHGVISENSSHCSPLHPTLTWYFQSGGYFLKSPTVAAHCSPLLHGNFSQGGNSLKVLPLQPISYIFLPPLNKLPPHSYINLPPIDNLPPILTSKWEDFREDIRPGKWICQSQ